ncbi:Tat (twin-arginine translocation) pathway signal sequence [Dyadobacter sp. SG02]|uniref:sugar phosphate isomerase/epimerase family protein n=1 Tax=Dyadobacter sp. SG02 TaxID=1855291 RepID=UPI0008D0292B|nr:TIM barrel protein [Dyadobacter sp. SG02]SEI54176.1 Tat (twin-arginine translocation) pathway signal sequence [Dyadobacter sp. SG02]
MDRRSFLKYSGLAAGAAAWSGQLPDAFGAAKKPFFEISLAEWSLHRTLQEGKLVNMDFPAKAKNDFGISAVEYVDQFFRDKAKDQTYLSELKQRTADLGVRNVLIMIDTAGPLADPDAAKRKTAVENHYQWVDAAKFLGCHSIRVNLRGTGSAEDMALASIDGLGALSEYGKKAGIGVLVENHGGFSSDAKWLAGVITKINNPYCGTLPDFDNFCLERAQNGCAKSYDRYQGTEEMMPFAKGLSAKSRDFDASGNETTIDFRRLLTIAKKTKTKAFQGYAGIEYSGTRMSEDDGIRATKLLLQRIGAEIA